MCHGDGSESGSGGGGSSDSDTSRGGEERKGRTKDRSRPRRKAAGRASSIDFIRKVPVSPFRRDNTDQQHDSLERQRLNHTIRARSKSSSHVIAAHALFSNSAHSRPGTQGNQGSQGGQGGGNQGSQGGQGGGQGSGQGVQGKNQGHQGVECMVHGGGQGSQDNNQGVQGGGQGNKKGKGGVQGKNKGKDKGGIRRNSSEPFFDTQIPVNYVRNLARRFQSQEMLNYEDGEVAGGRGEKGGQENVVLVSMTETGESRGKLRQCEADNEISYIAVPPEPPMSISSMDSDSSRDYQSPSPSPSLVTATTLTPASNPPHAISASASSVPPTPCQNPDPRQPSTYHPHHHRHPSVTANPTQESYRGSDTMKGISSDSSDSVDKPPPPLSNRAVRGRYKSYLRDTMQFSFYTGEKGQSHQNQGLSSDDSVYQEPLPASPVVSDVSTSGCSSGTDDQSRSRWTDGSCSSHLLSYSSPPFPNRSPTSCLNSRGHVHTNGCYGQRQRQRSASPEKRAGPTSSPEVTRSLPSLPVTSDADRSSPSTVPHPHAKDPKVILRAAHLSNELVRLTQLLERLHPQELQHILLQRLRQRDSKAIVALGVVLPRTSFPSTEQVHCVRCHKNYDLRQPSACTLKHPAAYVVKTYEDGRGASFYCKACDGQFLLQGLFAYDEKINSYMAGFCFNGQHSTNPADVNFSGIVRTCEEQGCVECYV